MSRRIEAQTVKSLVHEPRTQIDGHSLKIEAFTLGRIQSEVLPSCENALCGVQFEQTGIMRMEPRRFCSPACRRDAWILRRAAEMLLGLSPEAVYEILTKAGSSS